MVSGRPGQVFRVIHLGCWWEKDGQGTVLRQWGHFPLGVSHSEAQLLCSEDIGPSWGRTVFLLDDTFLHMVSPVLNV